MSTKAHHEQASLFSDDTSTRRHPRHVLSYGLGLDSTAVLLRWLTDPSSRDFDLSDLVVITAMTGDEFSATGADVERYVLPELRRHRVRFVQVGRHQLLTTAAGEGITTFSDTTEPDRLFVEGAYALSTEMLTAGTLPQRGGARKCSARAKGAVLDPVIARLTGGQPYQHYVGFEVDEMGRAERDAAYNTAARTGRYPLIQWGWTRADCDTFVYNLTGSRWRNDQDLWIWEGVPSRKYDPGSHLIKSALQRWRKGTLRAHGSQQQRRFQPGRPRPLDPR